MSEYKNTPLTEDTENVGASDTAETVSGGTITFTLPENDSAQGVIISPDEKENKEEEIKVYRPKAPKYDADPDSPTSRALNFDIDEILKNLGIEIPEYDDIEKKADKTELEDISLGPAEKDTGVKASHTRAFKLPKKQDMGFSSAHTRHFHLDESLISEDSEEKLAQKRKNLMQNFRVLSKTQDQDQAILEFAGNEKGGKSIIDNVELKEGEDLFQAVEKAKGEVSEEQAGPQENPTVVSAQKMRKRRQKKQAIATGKNLQSTLEARLKGNRIRLVALAVILFGTFVLTVLPEIYPAETFPQFFFNMHFPVYILSHMLILALVFFISRETFDSGLDAIRYLSPNYDMGIVLMSSFSFIINLALLLISFIKHDKFFGCYYTLCIVFAVTVKTAGEYLKAQTALRSLITVMKSGSLESIQPVEDNADAAILSSGISDKGKTSVLYCADVDMNENLVDDIVENNNTQKFYALTSIIAVVFGIVAGMVFSAKSNSSFSFVSVLLSCISLCFPIMNSPICSLLSTLQNSKLNSVGAAATEYEGIRCVGKAKAVTVDISDIFYAQVSRFRRIRGASISQSDAAVFAATALKAGKSIVAGCFDSFIEELGITLPEAEDFQYEERMGFSCWIVGRRVLVGNRQMLTNHSISVPTEKEEKRYAGKNFVYYVVIDGETVATFLVDYKVIGSLRKVSPGFNKTGLVLVLTSKEASLDEKVVSSKLAIEMAAVKILSSKGTDIMAGYRRDKAMRISNGLVCSKKSKSLLNLIISSHNLYTANKLFLSLTVVAQIMGLVLLSLAMLLNMATFFNPITIVFLHLLWSVPACALCIKKLN